MPKNETKADNYFILAFGLGSFGFIFFSLLGLSFAGFIGAGIAQILSAIFTFVFSFKARKYGSTHKAGFIFGAIESLIILTWVMMFVISTARA